MTELAARPESGAAPASTAERARAQGEVAWAERDLAAAELQLRRSVACWLEIGAPLQAADVRLRLCQLLLEAADPTATDLELSAAEVAFRQVGAEALLQRCQRLLPNDDYSSWGPPFGHCEGARVLFENGAFLLETMLRAR